MRKLLIIIPVMLVVNDLLATHVIGLNVSYKHISGDSFEVYCDVPSNCPGTFFNNGNCSWNGPLPSSTIFNLYCEDQGFMDTIIADFDTVIDASPVCKSDPVYNACSYGPCGYMGVQMMRYKAIVDFSIIDTGSCNQWLMVYLYGARSSGQNYVSQPSNTVWSSLNREDYADNSSVQFKNPRPIPFYCAGQEVTYHWGAVDPDGDSLFWELDTAWDEFSSGSFTSINYASGYSPTQPLPGAISFNSSNGDISFTTTLPAGYIVGIYAVAIKVSEYDKFTGELKAQLHRDVHFMVVDTCDNEAPTLISELNSSAIVSDSFSIQTCQGQDIEIELVFADYDSSGALSGDSLSFMCNLGDYVDSVSFTHTGTNPDTFHISIVNFSSTTPEIWFNVFVEDNFCPHPGYQDYSFRILSGRQTFLRSDTNICVDDTIWLNAHGGDTFSWQVLNGPPIQVGTNFGCIGCQKPWIHPDQTTTYVVESNQPEACGNQDTLTVTVFDQYEINLEPVNGGTVSQWVYCVSDPIDSFMVDIESGVYSGHGIVDSVQGWFDPSSLGVSPGLDTIVSVHFVYSGSCANSHTMQIRVRGLANTEITSSNTFYDTLTSVQLTSYFSEGNWSDANNSSNITATGLFFPSAFSGPDSVLIIHVGNDSGCVNSDSMLVYILEPDSSVGIRLESKQSGIYVFPNPTITSVNVVSEELIKSISLHDLNGKLVLTQFFSTHSAMLDVSGFPKGTYVLTSSHETGVEYRVQMVIQ